jgi:hypothetical protein
MACLRPSPVMVLTPVLGEPAIASCPFCFSFSTTFDPIKAGSADNHDLHDFTSHDGFETAATPAARHRIAFKVDS